MRTIVSNYKYEILLIKKQRKNVLFQITVYIASEIQSASVSVLEKSRCAVSDSLYRHQCNPRTIALPTFNNNFSPLPWSI